MQYLPQGYISVPPTLRSVPQGYISIPPTLRSVPQHYNIYLPNKFPTFSKFLYTKYNNYSNPQTISNFLILNLNLNLNLPLTPVSLQD